MKKNLPGTLSQLLLRLFLLLLNFFVKTSKSKVMKPLQVWDSFEGSIKLSFPEYNSSISIDQDSNLVAIRGSLPSLDWIIALSHFISIYRKELS